MISCYKLKIFSMNLDVGLQLFTLFSFSVYALTTSVYMLPFLNISEMVRCMAIGIFNETGHVWACFSCTIKKMWHSSNYEILDLDVGIFGI